MCGARFAAARRGRRPTCSRCCASNSVRLVARSSAAASALLEVKQMSPIIISWYLAAMSGGVPASTAPVIMPGIETRPRTFIVLSVGISPVRSASCALLTPTEAVTASLIFLTPLSRIAQQTWTIAHSSAAGAV